MPTRGLSILAAVTVSAVVACWIAIDERYRGVALEERTRDLVFPAFNDRIDSVTHVAVSRADGRFVLARRAGGWANMGIGGYSATSTRLEDVLGAVAGLRYVEPRTKRRTLHHKLGVEDVAAGAKSTRLTIKDAAGAVLADVIAGKRKEAVAGRYRQGTYIRLPGDERAWLAEGSLDVHHDAPDWSDRAVVDIDAGALATLVVTHADGEVVALHRNRPGDRKLALMNPPAGAGVEHQYQIDYMAGLLQGVEFDDAMRAGMADLEAIPAFEVVAQSQSGLAVTLRASAPEEDGSVWTRIEATVSGEAPASDHARQEAARINAGFNDWSVKLPRTVTDRLRIRLGDIIGGPAANQ
ncbi:MAG: DUF4340 domain-containing protein [Thiotrichales bacterium]|nr:DUF4340 domain-containing protein [Thiotrichales bacterium]